MLPMDNFLVWLERKATIWLGFTTALVSVVGAAALIVATGNPRGLAAFAAVYWPGTIVVLILTGFLFVWFEFGLHMMRTPEPPARTLIGRAFSLAVLLVFVVSYLVLIALAIPWLIGGIGVGLQPTGETAVVGITILLYAALRVGLKISHANPSEVGRWVGIERGRPDPGERQSHFVARLVVGFLIGIPLLDSFVVFLGAVLAPDDNRIYPFLSENTDVAAALWIVGLASVGMGLGRFLRGRATAAKSVANAVLAVVTLVPAFLLDARVPLYPLALAQSGSVSIGVGPVTVTTTSSPLVRTPASNAPTTTPGSVSLTGRVMWGVTPVQAARVWIQDRQTGIAGNSTFTDVYGIYSFSVQPGSYTVYVDASNTPGGYLIGSVLTKLDVAPSAGPVTYPTIALYKRISVLQPASGAVVRSPVTFTWDAL